jgi:hypothetical protein
VVSVNVDLLAPLSNIVSVVPFTVRLRAGHMCVDLSRQMSASRPHIDSVGEGGGVRSIVIIMSL